MKKAKFYKINLRNILDIMYEPSKNRYSILEYNGTRKEITRDEFQMIIDQLRSKE